MKNSKNQWYLIAIVLIAITTIALMLASMHTDKEMAKEVATQYCKYMKKGDYAAAFNLLYRSEDTLFTDEFLINASQNEPLLSFSIQDVRKITDVLYEITSTVEIDDGKGARTTTNYVIKNESQFFFVIHWTDIPKEIIDY